MSLPVTSFSVLIPSYRTFFFLVGPPKTQYLSCARKGGRSHGMFLGQLVTMVIKDNRWGDWTGSFPAGPHVPLT